MTSQTSSSKDFFVRAQIVKLRVDELADEARRSRDPARIRAIGDEIEVALNGLREIRREQLTAELDPLARPKRRWWRRRAA